MNSNYRITVEVPKGTIVFIDGSPLTLVDNTIMEGNSALFEKIDKPEQETLES